MNPGLARVSLLVNKRKNLQTSLERDSLHRIGEATMNLLDLITSVLIFTTLVYEVDRRNTPAL
jgi:hypothetical protein